MKKKGESQIKIKLRLFYNCFDSTDNQRLRDETRQTNKQKKRFEEHNNEYYPSLVLHLRKPCIFPQQQRERHTRYKNE